MNDVEIKLPTEQEQQDICRRFAFLLRKDIQDLRTELLCESSDLISLHNKEWVHVKEFLDGPVVIAKSNSRIRFFVTNTVLAEKLLHTLRDGIPEYPLCFEVCLGTMHCQRQDLIVHVGAFGVLCSKATQALFRKEATN